MMLTQAMNPAPPLQDVTLGMPSAGPHSSAAALYGGRGFDDDQLLSYFNDSTGNVAFVDESYQEPNKALGGSQTFYILAAVVVPRGRIAATREKLLDISGSDYWHTSSRAAASEAGKADVLRMSRYIARSCATVLAIRSPIQTADRTGEQARRSCFNHLIPRLIHGRMLDPQGVLVYEQRRDSQQRKTDAATMSSLRSRGLVPDSFYIHEGTPGREALLWAPDVLAWSERTWVSRSIRNYIEPAEQQGTLRRVNVP